MSAAILNSTWLHVYTLIGSGHHWRGVLISGPVDYLYVYIYSWEFMGSMDNVMIIEVSTFQSHPYCHRRISCRTEH